MLAHKSIQPMVCCAFKAALTAALYTSTSQSRAAAVHLCAAHSPPRCVRASCPVLHTPRSVPQRWPAPGTGTAPQPGAGQPPAQHACRQPPRHPSPGRPARRSSSVHTSVLSNQSSGCTTGQTACGCAITRKVTSQSNSPHEPSQRYPAKALRHAPVELIAQASTMQHPSSRYTLH
jgi:hypothetical protein